jgi:hypothetical protein
MMRFTFGDPRADVRRHLARMADVQLAGSFYKPLDEFVFEWATGGSARDDPDRAHINPDFGRRNLGGELHRRPEGPQILMQTE